MLPRAARLRKRRDFQAVYRTRKCWSSPCLALHARTGGAGVRLGFVISTKVAKRAHDRNKLKRRMREISRQTLLPRLRPGMDALFVARVPALALSFGALSQEMASLMAQAGLLAAE